MKNIIFKTSLNKVLDIARRSYGLAIKGIVIGTLLFAGIQLPLNAQNTKDTQDTKYTAPSWRFGVSGAANFNFYRGTTQQLSTGFMAPGAFHDGKGIGLFVAPIIEFHRPTSMLGIMLQAGYDSRRGSFDQVMAPCNCPEDLDTDLDYITIEPSLRFAPFRSSFYLYAGPRFAFNLNKNFNYTKGVNPDFPGPVFDPEVNDEFSEIKSYLISMQIGMGYDINLSSENSKTKVILSPFVSYHPYFGQDPRSIESWNITTIRAGLTLKFGSGHKVDQPVPAPAVVPFVAVPVVRFTVNSPENIPIERKVRETFPLLNYVFFDLGSTIIPDRYVLLKKDQVKDFKEDQLEQFKPIKLSGRSSRQMVAYYNVLNILGDRMGKNPSSSITLVGSSEKGSQDGRLMAESVKHYLVDVFGIKETRINIQVQDKPKIPSEQPGRESDLKVLREEDRRVSIESNSPALLMEFQSGPDVRLKPVEIIAIQEAPIDSYVTFKVVKGNEILKSWSVETKDNKGGVQTFGPYTQKEVSLPGKLILGNQAEGNYKVTMIGITKDGITVKRDTTVQMKLWVLPKDESKVGMRFSVIYEFDDSKAIAIYEKYLTEIVTPKIPIEGLVRIHGYTDIIGDAANNQRLSLARANDVKKIIESSLSKLGRKDVKFEVYGFGEDQKLSQFENESPEERFYNRTVIIDIIPQK